MTWNQALQLSLEHQVWVVTHPQHRAVIEHYLREHPNPHLRFVWVTLPRWVDPWRAGHGEWKGARGERGLRLHYIIWQHLALRAAVRIHSAHDLDITHHISWGTLSAPPLLWQVRAPFVWGPIGGGQTAPRAFRRYFGSAWLRETARSVRVAALPLVPAVRQAAGGSALVLATNGDTSRLAARAGAGRLQLFPDAGINPEDRSPSVPDRSSRAELTLLWAGRLEHRKALPLALEALAQVRELPAKLLVAGDGPLGETWRALALRLGLHDRVQFLGRVPWQRMQELFDLADVFVFTSLRDSFGAVVLEAMAHGLPLLALDHHGIHDVVPATCGVKVAVTTPAATVAGLARGIRVFAASAEARTQMGEAAWEVAGSLTWAQRARQLSAWYEECLKNRRS